MSNISMASSVTVEGSFQERETMRSGYRTTHHVANKIFNISAATVLLILSFPFFIIIPIIVKLQDGGPVFYKGIRLGRHKKKFYMYKFRTLVPNAEQIIGAQLVNAKLNLITPIGKILRETRLDELPQIINVLKGEMDLVGPRPERPIIYEQHCKDIVDYDRRFEVKPGVVGYSQLFTPHSSPKRVRVLIDNFYVRRKQDITHDWFFFVNAITLLATKALHKASSIAIRLVRRVFYKHSFEEKRTLERINQRETHVTITSEDAAQSWTAKVVDINEDAFAFQTTEDIADDFFSIKLTTSYRYGINRSKDKSAFCTGSIMRRTTLDNGEFRYVIMYEATTPLNAFKLHKYYLAQSVSD